MNDKRLEQVLDKVDPARRTMLRKLVLGAGFAVPVIASFSVKELAAAGTGSLGTLTITSTVLIDTEGFTTTTSTSVVTFTVESTVASTVTSTVTSTSIVSPP
jgi:hypothetical protein